MAQIDLCLSALLPEGGCDSGCKWKGLQPVLLCLCLFEATYCPTVLGLGKPLPVLPCQVQEEGLLQLLDIRGELGWEIEC